MEELSNEFDLINQDVLNNIRYGMGPFSEEE
jgi:hypothetical protein